MNQSSFATKRVLAIDPTGKGFGFAILESPGILIDWGVKQVRGELRLRNRRCLEEISRLISRFQPDVLAVEHTGVKSCQRRSRARQLIAAILDLASAQDLRTRQVSRRKVQRCFSEAGTATKRQVAVALSERFPELEPYLPPQWDRLVKRLHAADGEDERFSIFDAVAFGLVFYEPLRREHRALSLLSGEMPQSYA
jgi:Holliday junction resolvasome RuvABC endonuclease subunit